MLFRSISMCIHPQFSTSINKCENIFLQFYKGGQKERGTQREGLTLLERTTVENSRSFLPAHYLNTAGLSHPTRLNFSEGTTQLHLLGPATRNKSTLHMALLCHLGEYQAIVVRQKDSAQNALQKTRSLLFTAPAGLCRMLRSL